ncbi:MAG: BrnA antitoxin family protein [Butyrivibrio sp.]|uniref:BrnA antitoxin family protein n=1 Tax=Butyrivibrio sp. TaxID=28121 RepID=UPI001B2BCCBB|nr:BrnA antitoxin family protein [Butyrivibrio sp.]MBO6242790.1 BrnA antitoxin family protein [Butyrivibrio sp.]
MATVTMKLNPGDQPTIEQIKEIEVASKKPIKFTEDAPELSDEELSQFKPANPKYYRPNKELISLRLDTVLVDAFKSTGKGYQTRINEALWKGAQEMGIIKQQ